MRGLGTVLGLLGWHAALVVGTPRHLPLPERVLAYPGVLASVFAPEILGPVAEAALQSAAYLLGGVALAWGLAGVLRRAPLGLLWVLDTVPPFLLLLLGVALGLAVTLRQGWTFPLTPWSPLMLALMVGSLALPMAARAAGQGRAAYHEALAADHSRAARAMGLPEAQVQRRAAALARPVQAASLGADALGLALSLALLEGLLHFPGVGDTVYLAVQGQFSETGQLEGERLTLFAGALLALLVLAALAHLGLRWAAARLDPRPLAEA
ncbi:ABC transporter permease subunit [Deinococcus multiflagellatus]|uniref:ABC transporter permease subunit n=1 Tax=Deinococcus multiflagellatus TaxID=1656887 RepID=UPI001CCA5151|nr:ABC transporter permease subunit [Deinococcus multiflagellatus]MBZ9713193.1 ABC transporter permease subunit [Deinococcus multiflagellatus]